MELYAHIWVLASWDLCQVTLEDSTASSVDLLQVEGYCTLHTQALVLPEHHFTVNVNFNIDALEAICFKDIDVYQGDFWEQETSEHTLTITHPHLNLYTLLNSLTVISMASPQPSWASFICLGVRLLTGSTILWTRCTAHTLQSLSPSEKADIWMGHSPEESGNGH